MEQLDAATDTSTIDVTPPEQAAAENRITEEADASSAQDGKAEKPADGDVDVQASTATVCIAFRDFGFEPIEGLKYKLKVDDQFKKGITDAEGNATTLTDLTPGSDIEIFVFREHEKDFKSIGSLRAYPGCTGYSIVSPKLKYEVTTELHSGEPGGAEMNMPPSSPVSKDSEQESAPCAPAGTLPLSDTATKREVPSAIPAQGKPTTLSPGAKTTTESGSGPRKKGQAIPGRNSNGHPQATIQDSTLDRLKRKILGVFNFWHWQDFQEKAPQPPDSASNSAPSKKSSAVKNQENQTAKNSSPLAPAQAAQGHPKVNPLGSPAVATPGKKLEGADLTRLQALINFAEKQVEFDYLPYKGKEGTTVNVLKEYAKQEMPTFGTKPPIKPLGLCQVYVKIALFKAGYTNGPGWEGQAKTSGRDWLKYGFTEVGSTLPQIEITYEDALSPSDRTQAETCIKRKAALKKLQEERRKQKKPMTAEEIASVEKDIPSMPEKKRKSNMFSRI